MLNLSDVVKNFSRFGMLRSQSFLDRRQRASIQFQRCVEPIAFAIEISEIVVKNAQFVMFLFSTKGFVDDFDRPSVERFGRVVIGLFLSNQAERVQHFCHLDVLGSVGALQRDQRLVVRRFGRFEIALLKTTREERRERRRKISLCDKCRRRSSEKGRSTDVRCRNNV